jgi:hypothetical protein
MPRSPVRRLALTTIVVTRCAAGASAVMPESAPRQGRAADAQPPAALPQTTLPLRLSGLALDSDRPGLDSCVIGFTASGERGGLLKVGDRACGVAEIREIRPDLVVIENLALRRRELLTFPARSSPAAAGSVDASAGGSGRPAARDEINGQALDGPPTIMRLLGEAQTSSTIAAIVMRDGQRLAWVVNTVKGPQ